VLLAVAHRVEVVRGGAAHRHDARARRGLDGAAPGALLRAVDGLVAEQDDENHDDGAGEQQEREREPPAQAQRQAPALALRERAQDGGRLAGGAP
jgi:hypothetical protein